LRYLPAQRRRPGPVRVRHVWNRWFCQDSLGVAEADLLLLLIIVLLVAGRVEAEPGSRWSARSGARTNDLDAGEHRRRVKEEDGSLEVLSRGGRVAL